MKKTIYLRAALMAALTLGLALSCAKEPVQPSEEETVPEEVIDKPDNPSTITATIPDETPEPTKVSLTPGTDGIGLAMAWEEGDQLTVIGNTTETFTIVEGFTAKDATFSGNPVSGESFTVIYPGSYATEAAINERTYTSQVQNGNADTDHLEWNAMIGNVPDYSTLSFSGAGCKQNGALKFYLQLPDDFSTVEWVSLSTADGSQIFSTTNDPSSAKVSELKLTLSNVDVSESNHILTAYMMVSWNENAIAAGTELLIKVKGTQDGEPWVKTMTVGESGFTIAGGKVTRIKLNNSDWEEPLFWGGSGTQADPYIITQVKHMHSMNNLIASHEGASKLWFKLGADIDMDGVAWGYKNSDAAHNWPIDFDGGGYSIQNFSMTKWSASLFGALVGCVHDVTFTNAVITTASGSSGGLLAYRGGRKASNLDAPLDIINVDVNGLTVTGGTAAVGGLVGRFANGTMNNCHITGLVLSGTTGGKVGGLAGEVYEGACSFTGCSVAGTITSSGAGVGGIVGFQNITGCSYEGCSFSGSVTGAYVVGGLIGGNTDSASNVDLSFTIDNCHTEGSVEATSHGSVATTDASFVGGLIGRARNNTQTDAIVITSSWSSSNVTGNDGVVGGLVGEAVGVTIGAKSGDTVVAAKACEYKNGTITGAGSGDGTAGNAQGDGHSSALGGIVAFPRGSYATKVYGAKVSNATLSGVAYVGGVVGQNRKMDFVAEGCVVDANTSITATGNYVGGIMGHTASSTQSISSNEVYATISGTSYLGGIVGGPSAVTIAVTDCAADVTISGTSYLGGIVGGTTTGTTSVTGCIVDDASITSTSGTYLGGILGGCGDGTISISNSVFAGTVSTSGSNVGGIMGGSNFNANGSKTITISSCSSAATLQGNQNVGGILGRSRLEAEITGCRTSGSCTSTKSSANSYVGGIVANMMAGTVTNCISTSSLDGENIVGGVVGSVYWGNVTVSGCAFAGSISSTGNDVGGLVAWVYNGRTLTLNNSYSAGSVTSSGDYIGGLVGRVGSGNSAATLDMSNCYSRAKVKTTKAAAVGAGGLIGGTDQATTVWNVSKCLAWNEKIDFSAVTSTNNGAVIGMIHSGSSSASTSFSNCWYVNGLDFTSGGHTLGNDNDLSSSPGSAPYDGKTVASGISCQDEANTLSWPTSFWKLDNTDGFPSLKNLPE